MRARFAGLVQLLVCGARASSPPSQPPADLQGTAALVELGSGSGAEFERPPSPLRPPPSPLQPPPTPSQPPSLPPPQMPVIVAFKASGTEQEFKNKTVIEGMKAAMGNVTGVVSGYASNPHLCLTSQCLCVASACAAGPNVCWTCRVQIQRRRAQRVSSHRDRVG